MAAEFEVIWNEDDSPTILGRITARNGSGSYTGVRGEGNWVQVVDISSITRYLFDLDGETPDVPIDETEVTPDSVILDTPDTSGHIWTKDNVGINYLENIDSDFTPDGDHRYELEYEIVMAGGARQHAVFKGPTRPVRHS